MLTLNNHYLIFLAEIHQVNYNLQDTILRDAENEYEIEVQERRIHQGYQSSERALSYGIALKRPPGGTRRTNILVTGTVRSSSRHYISKHFNTNSAAACMEGGHDVPLAHRYIVIQATQSSYKVLPSREQYFTQNTADAAVRQEKARK